MKKLISRLKEDRGNSVIILGLIVIIALIVVGGTITDVSKAYQMKSSQTEAARKATQAGIRIQSSEGYLVEDSVLETVRVYNNITRPSVVNTDPNSSTKKSHFERCGSGNDLAPRILRVWLSKSGRENDYYTEIIFDLDKVNVSSKSNGQPQISKGQKPAGLSGIGGSGFDTMNINIVESTPNAILPLDSTISGKKFSRCQRLPVKASASTFLGEDNKYN